MAFLTISNSPTKRTSASILAMSMRSVTSCAGTDATAVSAAGLAGNSSI